MLLMSKSVPEIRRLRAKGLNVGLLVTPQSWSPPPDDFEWALDNDGFQGVNIPAWLKVLAKVAGKPGCLFVVAPDVVSDAKATMHLFMRYAPVIRDCDLPVAYALQDGLIGVGVPWDLLDAIFIGGSTEFKFGTQVSRAVAEAHERGVWTHMGRVNTKRRMEYAASLGVESIDGTKWSRWTDTYVHELERLPYQQQALSRLEGDRG